MLIILYGCSPGQEAKLRELLGQHRCQAHNGYLCSAPDDCGLPYLDTIESYCCPIKCGTCNQSCDDNNRLTADSCSKETNYSCVHKKLREYISDDPIKPGVAEKNTQPVVKKKNTQPCEDEDDKSQCYYNLALKNRDNNICGDSGPYKVRCVNEILFIKAIEEQDILKCDEINYTLNNYRIYKLLENKNAGINSPYDEAFVNANDLKLACKYAISLMTENLNLCLESLPGECMDNCYFRFAPILKKISFCDDMNNDHGEKYADSCKIDRGTTDISWCKTNYAIKHLDISICSQVDDSLGCELSVAEASKDPLFCEKLSTAQMKEKCYYSFARQLKDESLCHKTGDFEIECFECLINSASCP